MKPSELSRFWFRETLAEIRADPSHFLRHTFLKARLLFNHYEVPATNSYYFFREHVAPIFKLPTPSYGALLPLALCGMFFTRRNRRTQVLTLFFFTYALTVILTFNMSRYRMPLVPIVILFASVGFKHILGFVTERRLREAVLALGFLVVCYPVVYQNLTSDNFAGNYLNLGIQLLRSEISHRDQANALDRSGDSLAAAEERAAMARQSALAEQQFRLGLDIQPKHPGLQKALGSLLLMRVREQREAADYENALVLARELTATLPGFADGYAALGRAHSDLGNFEEARRALRRALALSPGHRGASAELQFVDELHSAEEQQ